jgi:hypothetical protein
VDLLIAFELKKHFSHEGHGFLNINALPTVGKAKAFCPKSCHLLEPSFGEVGTFF